jgi:DNA-binding NarL/FixJ family response regulator
VCFARQNDLREKGQFSIRRGKRAYFAKTMSRRILIVEDYEPFGRYVREKLEQQSGFQVVGEAVDGFDAIEKAEELQPDLILLDVGLPRLNGFEAAKRIRYLAPRARILFLSQEFSFQIAEAALRLGALGYVHKLRAQSELLSAVENVALGRYFVTGISGPAAEPVHHESAIRHEVQFCSDDAVFLESFTDCIAAALDAGKTALMIVNEPHRQGILKKLMRRQVDVDHAMTAGLLVLVDNMELLSQFMVDESVDPARLFEVADGLIAAAAKPGMNTPLPKLAICGELAPVLLSRGQVKEALRLEQLWHILAHFCRFDLLCGYALPAVEKRKGLYECICSEHSAARSR